MRLKVRSKVRLKVRGRVRVRGRARARVTYINIHMHAFTRSQTTSSLNQNLAHPSQVGMSSSAMARGKASQYAVCAQVVRSRIVPSPGGGQEAAGVYVASSLVDFAAERRHLDRVLVPGLQSLLRPFRVSLSCCDLRLGGAKQAFGQVMILPLSYHVESACTFTICDFA